MAPKKAPKKAAKKVAKKAAKKSAKHHESKDLRRAYEHMGRLEALSGCLQEDTVQHLKTLSQSAKSCLSGDDNRSAADLLRAGEHFAFASLAPLEKDTSISKALSDAIEDEYEHLLERAARHSEERENVAPAAVSDLYNLAVSSAQAALKKGAYRRALEYARAAEALAHVDAGTLRLEGNPRTRRQLRG